MLLVMDVGNTNIKAGLFAQGKLRNSWRLASSRRRTADELGIQMEWFFRRLGISTAAITGVIISSVIPSLNYTLEHMCSLYFYGRKPMMVDAGLDLGFVNRYDRPDQLGSDRICNIVAAKAFYGGPVIVIDFGTATNFVVLDSNADFVGGVIFPGFQVATEALAENTAMLPKVEYIKPRRVICTNTEQALQAGILYGYVGQIEYLVNKTKEELGTSCNVVATGGMSAMIAAETGCIDFLNPTLTLEGLSMVYARNTK